MTILHEADGAACADCDTDIAVFGRFARGEKPSGDRRPPLMIVPGPPRANRTERPDLKTEIERLLADGWPELAAERFFSAILTAGLAATIGDQTQDSKPYAMPARNGLSVLTRREREVAALIAAGRTNRSIANELFIAQSTVERHVANMLNKLGFNSRAQIAAWTVTNGLSKA